MDRIDQLRTFLQQDPDQPFPRYALALELKSRGDPKAAVTELEELLRRAPDYLAAYLQLGMLLQGENRFADAKGVLERGQQVARKQGNSHTLSELTSALEALPV